MADPTKITWQVLMEYDSDGDGVNDAKKIKVFYDGEDIIYEVGVPLTMSDTEILNFLVDKLTQYGY
jgi:hypothetical protein